MHTPSDTLRTDDMKIFELYKKRRDINTGCFIGTVRVAMFIDHAKMLAFKQEWEKKWVENGMTTTSPCFIDCYQGLVVKEAETYD